MAVTRYITAAEIVNRAAVECGLLPSDDVFAETAPEFIQLRNLLSTCGQDLCEAYPWEILSREHSITTTGSDTGDYDLPDDFGRMVPQTGWEQTDNVPLGNPLSPQQWAYLQGRDLVDSSIYVSFRIAEDKFSVFPQPPTAGLTITFEYVSRNWVLLSGGTEYADVVSMNSDQVLFKPVMIVQYLRFKFLEAKGLPSEGALGAFKKAYEQATGGNKGAPILNLAGPRTHVRFLSHWNLPDTGFG